MKVFFDVETTGLDVEEDEILQLSMIDEYDNILFHDYFSPVHKKAWEDAERIHHITVEMVEGKASFEERKDEIQKIFSQATELIAYNSNFDISFLKAAGIQFPTVLVSDPMYDFAIVYGEYSEWYGTYKWQKLTTAAHYYGYEFNAHDSLEDIKATKFVYEKLQEESL